MENARARVAPPIHMLVSGFACLSLVNASIFSAECRIRPSLDDDSVTTLVRAFVAVSVYWPQLRESCQTAASTIEEDWPMSGAMFYIGSTSLNGSGWGFGCAFRCQTTNVITPWLIELDIWSISADMSPASTATSDICDPQIVVHCRFHGSYVRTIDMQVQALPNYLRCNTHKVLQICIHLLWSWSQLYNEKSTMKQSEILK